MTGANEVKRLRDALQQRVPSRQYKTWFAALNVEKAGAGGVTISTDSRFKRDWLERYYGDMLREVVASVFAEETTLNVVVADPGIEIAASVTAVAVGEDTTRAAVPAPPAMSSPAARRPVRQSSPKPSDGPDLVLNRKYTFDNFVVGPSNQFAHAAARAVADKPAASYNPLFLHSYVGLGKTHLLQAICHQARQTSGKQPNVLYLSSETFMNEFIASVGKGELDRFRYRYRNADILLIDDIHLLANKERTQEEFFNTFNTLYNADRQIVLSSDSPPDEIPSLRERLVSRFKWGLVAEIRPPGFETRLAILRHKANALSISVPEDVLSFLAETVDTNIRELEGAITKTTGYAQLTGQTICLDLAHQALGLGPRDATQQVTGIERIVNVVCKHYAVTLADILGRKRTQSITLPRQVAMFLARRLTPHSLEELGEYFGKRDHTTVLYGVDKIRNKAKEDPRFQQLLHDLEARIQR